MIYGKIIGYDGKKLTLTANFKEGWLLEKQKIEHAEIRLLDGRGITVDQRKKIYAILGEIASYTGHLVEELKDIFKCRYIAETGAGWFSLSNCDMSTANQFLELLIRHCIAWDIPTTDNLAFYSPEINKYIYWCRANKKCACCRGKTELHHVDAVGMGRNRKEILHLGMRVLPLCSIHHAEAHKIGWIAFEAKYHLYSVALDEYLCRIYDLRC